MDKTFGSVRMKKNVRLLLLFSSFLAVVLSFQNCSEVKFKKQDSLNRSESASLSAISLVNQTVFEGQPVLLESIISTSSLNPSFIWLKDGAVLQGQGDSSLSISSAQLTDEGVYELIYMDGSEELGRTQAQLTVIQTYFGTVPEFSSHPQGQSLTEGQDLNLTVEASGDPEPTYQWQKDGVNISGQTGKTLSLSSIALSDAGTYRVVATNSNGSVTSQGALIEVKKECKLRTVSGVSCNRWGYCRTPNLNICNLISGLKSGDRFTVTTNVSGSHWVYGSNPKVRNYTFTYGSAKTDSRSSGGRKRNVNHRVYDGKCTVYGTSQYQGKSSKSKNAAIRITGVQPSCE